MNILDASLETIMKKIKCDPIYVDAMLYNICDFSDQKKCPFNKKLCDGNCSKNFEEVNFKEKQVK